MPENSTTFVMTNIQGNLKKTLGNLYGLRTWAEPPLAARKQTRRFPPSCNCCGRWRSPPGRLAVEYGFRQCKQELGWTDYRLTDFKDIEKWWEIIFDVYTMISLNSPAFIALTQAGFPTDVKKSNSVIFSGHQQWNSASGWKNTLNNLRLIVQPLLLFWLIIPWIDIFPNSHLLLGFNQLISAMNRFKPCYSSG